MIDYLTIDYGKSLKILEGVGKLVGVSVAFGKRREIQIILRALKDIYFFPDRTYSLLDRMAAGEIIGLVDLQRAETGFGNSEGGVYEAIEILEQFAHKNRADISLEVISDMRDILLGKGGARLAIVEFFMDIEDQVSSGKYEMQKEENAKRAKTLKEMLVDLNARIINVDRELRKLGK
jgi:hypothetical protein